MWLPAWRCVNKRFPGHVYAALKVQNLWAFKGLKWPAHCLPEVASGQRFYQLRLRSESLKCLPILGRLLPFVNLDIPFMIRWRLFPNNRGPREPVTIHYSPGLYVLLQQLKKIMLPLAVIISVSPYPASDPRHYKSSQCIATVFTRDVSVCL